MRWLRHPSNTWITPAAHRCWHVVKNSLYAALMRTVTHTSAGTPDIVDCRKLVEVAEALSALMEE